MLVSFGVVEIVVPLQYPYNMSCGNLAGRDFLGYRSRCSVATLRCLRALGSPINPTTVPCVLAHSLLSQTPGT